MFIPPIPLDLLDSNSLSPSIDLSSTEEVYGAIISGDAEVIQSLQTLSALNFSEEQQEELLLTACQQGYATIVQLLADKYGVGLLDKFLENGTRTALEVAVRAGYLEIAQCLLAAGVTPKATKLEENDSYEVYPLYWAIAVDHPILAALLYRLQIAGAQENLNPEEISAYLCVDTLGKSPLELAIEKNKPKVFAALYVCHPWPERLNILNGLIEKNKNEENFRSFFQTFIKALFEHGDQESLNYLLITCTKNEDWNTLQCIAQYVMQQRKDSQPILCQMLLISIFYSKHSILEQQKALFGSYELFTQSLPFTLEQICEAAKEFTYQVPIPVSGQKLKIGLLNKLQDSMHISPFLLAVACGRREIVSQLLSWYPKLHDPRVPNREVSPAGPAALAAANKHMDILEFILEKRNLLSASERSFEMLTKLAEHFLEKSYFEALTWIIDNFSVLSSQDNKQFKKLFEALAVRACETVQRESIIWLTENSARFSDNDSQLFFLKKQIWIHLNKFCEIFIKENQLENLKWLIAYGDCSFEQLLAKHPEYIRYHGRETLDEYITDEEIIESLPPSYVHRLSTQEHLPYLAFLQRYLITLAADYDHLDILKWLVLQLDFDLNFSVHFEKPPATLIQVFVTTIWDKPIPFIVEVLSKGNSPKIAQWLIDQVKRKKVRFTVEDIYKIFHYNSLIVSAAKHSEKVIDCPFTATPEIFAELFLFGMRGSSSFNYNLCLEKISQSNHPEARTRFYIRAISLIDKMSLTARDKKKLKDLLIDFAPKESRYQQIRLGRLDVINDPQCLKDETLTEEEQEKLLETACQQGYLGIIEQLVNKYGAQLLSKPLRAGRTTALEQAVLKQQAAVVSFLFLHGVAPQAISPAEGGPGLYPLHWAMQQTTPSFVAFLYHQQQESLNRKRRKLLSQEEQVQPLSQEEQRAYLCVDNAGKTPLQLAEELNEPQMRAAIFSLMPTQEKVAFFKSLSANSEAKESAKQQSSLFEKYVEAIFEYNDKETLALLIRENILSAETIVKDKTLIELAITHTQTMLFHCLQELLPEFNQNQPDWALLAAQSGALSILKHLVQNNAEQNIDLLLINAIKNEHWEIAEWLAQQLIESGAEPQAVRVRMIFIAILYSKQVFLANQLQEIADHSILTKTFSLNFDSIYPEETELPKEYKTRPLNNSSKDLKICIFLLGVLCGNILVVKHTLKQNPSCLPTPAPYMQNTSLVHAAANNQIAILDLLFKHIEKNWDTGDKRIYLTNLCDFYIEKDYLPALIWAVNKLISFPEKNWLDKPVKVFNKLVLKAVEFGKINPLNWLTQNFALFKLDQASASKTIEENLFGHLHQFIKNAIKNRELKALQWLVKYFNENFKSIISKPGKTIREKSFEKEYLLLAQKVKSPAIIEWLIFEQEFNIHLSTTLYLLPYPSGWGGRTQVHLTFLGILICENQEMNLIKKIMKEKSAQRLIDLAEIANIFSYGAELAKANSASIGKAEPISNPMDTMPEIFADLFFLKAQDPGYSTNFEFLTITSKDALATKPELKHRALEPISRLLNYVHLGMSKEAKILFHQRFNELLNLPENASIKTAVELAYEESQLVEFSLQLNNQAESSSSSSAPPQQQGGQRLHLPLVSNIGSIVSSENPGNSENSNEKQEDSENSTTNKTEAELSTLTLGSPT